MAIKLPAPEAHHSTYTTLRVWRVVAEGDTLQLRVSLLALLPGLLTALLVIAALLTAVHLIRPGAELPSNARILIIAVPLVPTLAGVVRWASARRKGSVLFSLDTRSAQITIPRLSLTCDFTSPGYSFAHDHVPFGRRQATELNLHYATPDGVKTLPLLSQLYRNQPIQNLAEQLIKLGVTVVQREPGQR